MQRSQGEHRFGDQRVLAKLALYYQMSFFFFWTDRLSLCNRSGCPETNLRDQAGLELGASPASASQVLRIKGVCHHTQLSQDNFLSMVYLIFKIMCVLVGGCRHVCRCPWMLEERIRAPGPGLVSCLKSSLI